MESSKETLAEEAKKEVVSHYGGGLNLSRLLGISHPAVSKWRKIPPFRAYQIEQLGDFTVEYMRPDIKTPRIALGR
jgi:DNA-binding transcriptional regulator YdaS (Cro superfamily)